MRTTTFSRNKKKSIRGNILKCVFYRAAAKILKIQGGTNHRGQRENWFSHAAPIFFFLKYKEEQIIETRDKPQYLDIQRYLSYLQYPDATKSSTKDLSLPPFKFTSSWQ